MNQIEEIEKLAIQCLNTDYSKPKSVAAHNNKVNKIRVLISNVNNDEININLLNNENTCSWVAFQSLENPEKCSKKVFDYATKILRIISKKDCLESLAAEMRLKELKAGYQGEQS